MRTAAHPRSPDLGLRQRQAEAPPGCLESRHRSSDHHRGLGLGDDDHHRSRPDDHDNLGPRHHRPDDLDHPDAATGSTPGPGARDLGCPDSRLDGDGDLTGECGCNYSCVKTGDREPSDEQFDDRSDGPTGDNEDIQPAPREAPVKTSRHVFACVGGILHVTDDEMTTGERGNGGNSCDRGPDHDDSGTGENGGTGDPSARLARPARVACIHIIDRCTTGLGGPDDHPAPGGATGPAGANSYIH